MKKLLTKMEACDFLKKLENHKGILNPQEAIYLSHIRICLLGELINLDMWGKDIDNIRPYFKECEKPTPNCSPEIIENYENYKESFLLACQELSIMKGI